MNKKNIIRGIQIAILALTVAAIAQELSKPKMERSWHGKVIGFIPYDFRLPTLERLKETYWNPYERHIFAPPVFGVGWSINFYSFFDAGQWTCRIILLSFP